MQSMRILGISVPALIYMPVFYLLWVVVLFLFKKIIFDRIRVLAKRNYSRFDEVFLGALNLPLILMIFASGVFVLDHIFFFGDNRFLGYVNTVFKAVAIVAIILFFDRFLRNLVEASSKRTPVIKQSKGVIRVLVRIMVLGMGLLILLDSFGISITPIMASLGIGSLAIALALQPTLENFFSGVQIVVDKPITVGQFIKLDSGEEGYVEKIGWRSTWVRMLPNNVVVLPNKILVNSKLINYYYPSPEMSLLVQVGVHYDSDLEHVEKVTIEVAKKTLEEVQGGVGDFSPFIRYHTFDDSSINFTAILKVKEFVDHYLVKHEFIKRLKKRFDEEGIVIPYPLVTLDWNDHSSPIKLQKEQ